MLSYAGVEDLAINPNTVGIDRLVTNIWGAVTTVANVSQEWFVPIILFLEV